MGNKRLIVAIIIVILLIVALIGGYLYLQNSTKQAKILQEEATQLAQLDITKEDINMQTKTTGKYAIVEETVKNYINDVKNMYNEMNNYCNDEAISQILSAENIQADDEELTVVEQKVNEYASKLEEYRTKAETITDENTIMQKINEKNLSDYYVEIYRSIMLNEAVQANLSSTKTLIEEAQEEAWAKIEGLEEVVEFLVENTRYWDIEDGKIQFTNVNKLTQYYQLLNGTVE